MKIKKLIVSTTFVVLAATTTFSITDATSREITKIVIQENKDNISTTLPIIAHRGFSSIEIENSKEAIETGFKQNYVDGVEIDIRLTQDEETILSHDEYINNKQISTTPLEELQNETLSFNSNLSLYLGSLLDTKSGNLIRERIRLLKSKKAKPITLKEALDIHNNYDDKILIIEIKYDDRDKNTFNDIIYSTLNSHHKNNIIIQSSDYNALIEMKNKYPDLEYHLVTNENNYDKINNQDLDGYVIRKNLINYDDIKKLIDDNKKVSVWTINNYQEYQNTRSMLKDLNEQVYYITDYPDALRTWHNITEKNTPKQKVKR